MAGPDRPLPERDALDLFVQSAVSVVPYMGGALQVLAEAERERFHRRLAEFEDDIALTGARAAVTAAFEDERRGTLIARAVLAAGASAFEAKRRALARAVATIATTTDDTELDDSELLVDALLALDEPQARLLRRLADWSSMRGLRTKAAATLHFATADRPHPAALAALIRIGAISEVDELYHGHLVTGLSYIVTSFGEQLLQLIKGGTSQPSSSGP